MEFSYSFYFCIYLKKIGGWFYRPSRFHLSFYIWKSLIKHKMEYCRHIRSIRYFSISIGWWIVYDSCKRGQPTSTSLLFFFASVHVNSIPVLHFRHLQPDRSFNSWISFTARIHYLFLHFRHLQNDTVSVPELKIDMVTIPAFQPFTTEIETRFLTFNTIQLVYSSNSCISAVYTCDTDRNLEFQTFTARI